MDYIFNWRLLNLIWFWIFWGFNLWWNDMVYIFLGVYSWNWNEMIYYILSLNIYNWFIFLHRGEWCQGILVSPFISVLHIICIMISIIYNTIWFSLLPSLQEVLSYKSIKIPLLNFCSVIILCFMASNPIIK